MDSAAIPICVACLMSTFLARINAVPNTFNVLNYGATGNGIADDSAAFVKAWQAACNAGGASSTLIVPGGKTYLLNPITFAGPCKSKMTTVTIQGTIRAPNNPAAWKNHDKSRWLIFSNVAGLTIQGPGMLDGWGKGWWDISCKLTNNNPGCNTLAPTMLTFQQCYSVFVSSVLLKDSPQTHILLYGSQGVRLVHLKIQSPGSSPNTDGIHIQDSNGIFIDDATIAAGDDCVSIGDQTWNINISRVACGPGHGISIGSVGRGGSQVKVEDINVRDVQFTGTTNGARIKTWQEGQGQVQRVLFSNMIFNNVQNPIIIDQHYCDSPGKCPETRTGVHINQVTYSGARGTSQTDVAINLSCSNSVPCTNIMLDSIQLAPAVKGKQVASSCNHAIGTARGIVQPKSCLLPA